MKKCIVLVLLLVGSYAGLAQKMRVGLKLGGNVSDGVGADAEESLLRLGAHAGAAFQFNVTQHIGLQAEAQYSLKGDNSLEYGPSIMHQLAYLDIPVLAQYTLDDVYLEAGPRVSRLLSVRSNDDEVVSAGKGVFNTQTYGFSLGFGYQNETGIQIGWRYNADLTPLYRDIDFLDTTVRTNIRNSTMQFYLGYMLGFGR
ncbi:porin family protein [Hymenobacter norwichensis]|uniref:porin family protein n=1 Tax=Hymenobacter norwichensis TaxID=223903 RepID=UPI00146B885E|nr:porin family protein [Hymenobacter norwichensis]